MRVQGQRCPRMQPRWQPLPQISRPKAEHIALPEQLCRAPLEPVLQGQRCPGMQPRWQPRGGEGGGDAPPQDSSRSNSASGSSAASACSAARSQRAAGSRGASAAASPRAAARASGLPFPLTTCASGRERMPLWQAEPAALAREPLLPPLFEEAVLLSTVAVLFTYLTNTARALVIANKELGRRQQVAKLVRAPLTSLVGQTSYCYINCVC